MNAVYDHIIAILIVGAIFVGTVVVMPTMSLMNLQAVDQQQLRNTALNVFDAMLLGRGCPSDWGSTFPFDQNNVETFGLAYSEECSLYVLDTDKVQRLDKDSPWDIKYPYAKDLLKLEGYGFRLNIFRPFTVDWDLNINDVTNYVSFAVNVTRSEDGRPIPNAQVSCTILCSAKNDNKQDEPIVVVTAPKTFFTNALGRCEGNEPMQIPPGYILKTAVAILKISVAGISTLVVAQTMLALQNVMKINTFGDTITLSIRDELQSNKSGVRKFLNIMTYDYDALTEIWEAEGKPPKITRGFGYVSYGFTFPGLKAMDPALILFTVSVTLGGITSGRVPVIVAGPFSLWDSSRVFSFGSDSEQVGNVAVKLRRFVVISGMTYIAELTLWKE